MTPIPHSRRPFCLRRSSTLVESKKKSFSTHPRRCDVDIATKESEKERGTKLRVRGKKRGTSGRRDLVIERDRREREWRDKKYNQALRCDPIQRTDYGSLGPGSGLGLLKTDLHTKHNGPTRDYSTLKKASHPPTFLWGQLRRFRVFFTFSYRKITGYPQRQWMAYIHYFNC